MCPLTMHPPKLGGANMWLSLLIEYGTLDVHVGDEIEHANKMAADNLHCNLVSKNI